MEAEVSVLTDAQLQQLAALLAGRRMVDPYWIGPATFDQTEVQVAISPGVVTTVCQQNPNRRGLILASPVAGAVSVGIVPPASTGQGFPIGSTIPPLMLNYATWGSLVTSQWYAISTAGVSITVIELVLRVERLAPHPGD